MKTRIYDFECHYMYKDTVGDSYYARGRINGRTYGICRIFTGCTKAEIVAILKNEIRELATRHA